ncbi:NADH ubiquinone oxidoreductase 20 kDa subunit [Desulfurococcus mucosus DSM 2162]|uniref:NADH ubiquinone oxidoreductase 20 kDa subunit n=1 Tax=Desulfurococcus mucosus (strain ATCC 35584 / DSM 2162 / JCM 9187 / O7/1) TaxID=765177 RepID=E8RAG2_DESM0|nr:NADH ubiquinone oxidoreductase [Desulfurococcus mucosus]ADV64372.1 NADH ubiquinone oxidoreductase 20 kDa subunit [Desulfurococcus mucosus DSM 2162]
MKKSIWVYHLNTGSCNACDIEILDALTPFHDAERFGVKLVGSPRHADVILMTGPVTLETLPKVLNAIEAAPRPRIIIALGSCGVGGGIWHDTYSTIGGIKGLEKMLKERGIRVDAIYYVPGCPIRPEALLYAIALIKGLVAKKAKGEVKYAE